MRLWFGKQEAVSTGQIKTKDWSKTQARDQ